MLARAQAVKLPKTLKDSQNPVTEHGITVKILETAQTDSPSAEHPVHASRVRVANATVNEMNPQTLTIGITLYAVNEQGNVVHQESWPLCLPAYSPNHVAERVFTWGEGAWSSRYHVAAQWGPNTLQHPAHCAYTEFVSSPRLDLGEHEPIDPGHVE